MVTVTLLRRQVNRLWDAGVIGPDDLTFVRGYSDSQKDYRVTVETLANMAEHYRKLMAAGVLDKWETRDGEKLANALAYAMGDN